ncbi:MAG TPA: IS1595 family transposase [Candidatus Saccharimonadales bacterium]|nr:IS1595 family transposase [Candidatus Saccharimonadales bacterium]
MNRYTIEQFNQQYLTEDACLDSIFRNRYGDLEACPNCGVVDAKFYRLKERKAYSCQHCRYQIHPLAGTIFHKSDTPLRSWFFAIYLFGTSKNGVSAKELERHLGVTYKTAWRIAKQIRLLKQQDSNRLSGVIEADETYIGGKRTSPKVR